MSWIDESKQEERRKELRSLRKEAEELDSKIKILDAVEYRVKEATIKIDFANEVLDRCKKERMALDTERKEKNKAILDGKVDIAFWQQVISVLKER